MYRGSLNTTPAGQDMNLQDDPATKWSLVRSKQFAILVSSIPKNSTDVNLTEMAIATLDTLILSTTS